MYSQETQVLTAVGVLTCVAIGTQQLQYFLASHCIVCLRGQDPELRNYSASTIVSLERHSTIVFLTKTKPRERPSGCHFLFYLGSQIWGGWGTPGGIELPRARSPRKKLASSPVLCGPLAVRSSTVRSCTVRNRSTHHLLYCVTRLYFGWAVDQTFTSSPKD